MLSKAAKFVLVVSLVLLLTGQAAVAASLVIASKDSVNKEKANYVCDGMDDHIEIQKVIDSLPSSGGLVELLEGTFNFGDSVEITKSNVTIKGAGKSTILKHNPTKWVKLTKDEEKGSKTISVEDISQFRIGQLVGISDEVMCPPQELNDPSQRYGHYYIFSEFHVINNISGSIITLDRELEEPVSKAKNARVAPGWVMIKAYSQTNLELRDFSIDCNRENVARIYDLYCLNYPGVESPPETILAKVHHGEEPTSAIYMDYAHNSVFRNLYLHDIPMSGIFLFDSNYVLVERNTIRDYGLKGYVNVFGDYTRIISNVVENSKTEDGIVVYDEPSSFTVVSNNIVRNCPRTCIDILGAGRAVVSGNNVYGGTTGNNGYGGTTGILLYTREGATLTGNYIEVCTKGVSLWGLPIAELIECPITITGNSLRDCGRGFVIDKTYNSVNVVGNAVSGIHGEAAVISAGDDSAHRFIISNNQFLKGTSADCAAIKLGGNNHFIFGNKIKGFQKGVWLESMAEGNVVERNEFTDVPEPIFDEGKENIKENNR